MLIYKQFTFDSAHFLPNVPTGHKCKVIHGHTYKLTVFVEGDLLKEPGWLIDYADLKKAIMPVIEMIDHQFLNNMQDWKILPARYWLYGFGIKLSPGFRY